VEVYKYFVNNLNYSVGHPPDNPPTTTDDVDDNGTIDRLSIFTGEDRGPVWDMKPITPNINTHRNKPGEIFFNFLIFVFWLVTMV
jgi:hypothetical protein